MTRFVVLASGEGSNFQALADACARGDLDARIAALICDRGGAGVLRRAAASGIPARHVPAERGKAHDSAYRAAYDARLASICSGYEPDYIFLLGWMRILSRAFLDAFPGRVLNLHPALPGRYPGTDAIRRAWNDARAGVAGETGAMVHFVPDERVDEGPPVAIDSIAIDPDRSLQDLEHDIHELEHRLVVRAARALRRS